MIRATARISLPLMALLTLTAGCGPQPAAPPKPADTPAAQSVPAVTLVHPQRKTLRRTIEQPGRIEAFEQTPLHVKIAGYAQKVHVNIGDRVRKDQILAELSVPEMDQELKQKTAFIAQAEAEVKQAESAFEAARANLKTAEAMVEEAKAGRKRAQANCERWESEYERMRKLVANKAIDLQVRDEALNQFRAAEAAREEVEAKVKSAEALRDESKAKGDKANADVEAAKARKQVAEADRERFAALLNYAKVRAPFDGVVTRRHIDTGHFLQPATGAKGEPLFVVVRTDPVRVIFDLPETDAVQVTAGAKARVRVQALQGQEFDGKVTRSAWSLDGQARTLRTEIDLPNPDGKLRPGMYAYASIILESADVLTLPATAVVTQGEQSHCFRVEGDKVVRLPIKIGVRDGQMVEVVKKKGKDGAWEDFSGKEEIVERDAKALTDGQTVTVAPKQ